MIGVQLLPWSRRVPGSNVLCRLPVLGGFQQAANSVDKKAKKTAGTLHLCKLLSRCGFVLAQSNYRNDTCVDNPTVSVSGAG